VRPGVPDGAVGPDAGTAGLRPRLHANYVCSARLARPGAIGGIQFPPKAICIYGGLLMVETGLFKHPCEFISR
jgi:hypothetical protein